MQRIACFSSILAMLAGAAVVTDAAEPKFTKLKITDKFYSEGAYYADFNKDGKLDVVAGPFILLGPDFQKKIEYYEVKEVDPHGYSEHFMSFTGDFNGDGWPDVLAIPHPGRKGFWYENPAGKEVAWKKHDTGLNIGGESPAWVDVNKDGRPDVVYCEGGSFGYGMYDPSAPEKPWTFVSVAKGGYGQYSHGQGAGDINGDGRVDLLDAGSWFEQPAEIKPGETWKKHPAGFGGGANLLVVDVDGDGLKDVITASPHGYGLWWVQQVRNDKDEISFKQHVILSPNPDVKSDALRISQLHALDMADFNGDGVMDFVTGKRFWAHGPGGDAEPAAPAVLYWFETKRNADKTVTFVPHKMDDDSGVGVQITAIDVNGDKVPDVLSCNKKGISLFLSGK